MTTTTQPETTEATPTALRLETEPCSRCGGSGHYSYCQQYGTTCFKCRGGKVTYTKRGLAAHEYMVALRSRRADSLKAGDKVWWDSITMAGDSYAAWYVVESVQVETQRGASLVDGVMTPYSVEGLTIEMTNPKPGRDGLTAVGVPFDRAVRVAMSKADLLETLKAAVAYQGTLTKAGTVRKTAK